jgi:hypothetical protein
VVLDQEILFIVDASFVDGLFYSVQIDSKQLVVLVASGT